MIAPALSRIIRAGFLEALFYKDEFDYRSADKLVAADKTEADSQQRNISHHVRSTSPLRGLSFASSQALLHRNANRPTWPTT